MNFATHASLLTTPDDVLSYAFCYLTILDHCLIQSVCRKINRCVLTALNGITVLDRLRLEGILEVPRAMVQIPDKLWATVLKYCPKVKVIACVCPIAVCFSLAIPSLE